MATDLSVKIGGDLSEIRTALAWLRSEFGRVGQAANQAGGTGTLAKLEGSVSSAISQVRALVATLAAATTALKLIGAADELNTLYARLKLVTGSADEFAEAQVKLFDLAQRSRSSLGETIGLYSRIAQATKDAGVGQETLLGVVETINQAVQLSGASTQAAEAALVQLGQGLASGALRGEELNSILEQTPALADAIAKGMGKTRGELRALGQAGKLTAEQVITALQKQRSEVADQFAQLPLTVGQSITLLRNAGLQLLGVFDTATGATSGLAKVIKDIADFLQSDAVLGVIVEFAKTWSDAFADIVADARTALKIIEDLTGNLAGTGENAVQMLVRAFTELPRNIRSVVRIVTAIVAGMVDAFIADATLMKEAFMAIFTDDTVEAAIERRNRRVTAALQAVKDSIDDEVDANRSAAAEANAAGQAAIEARRRARAAAGNTGRGRFRSPPTAEQLRAAQALLKAELAGREKLTKDAAKRELEILKEQFDDAKIATAAYYAERQRIELEAIDREIVIEKEKAKAGPVEARKALDEITLLERQKNDVRRKAQREEAADRKALDRQLADAQIQLLEQQGQTADAAALRLNTQFADLRKRLVEDSNTAGVALIDKLIDTGKSKARFDEIKAQFDKTVADLQRRRQEIADQVQIGSITPAVGREQEDDAQQQAMQRLAAMRQQLLALAADPNALPAVKQAADEANAAFNRLRIEGLTGLDAAIVDLRAQLAQMDKSFAQSATGAGVDALTGLFTDLVSGTKSAGEALKDFVRGFVQSMAQIAARALATYLVLQLLDAVYPGLGRTVAASMSVGASVQHAGGMAGHGPKRDVPGWVFAGAPRYHNGGDVGIRPGEVPAILQVGERVQSRAEVQAERQGAQQGGTRIINVIDPNLVGDYMTSASGERTILNVIERNAGAIRQKLS